MNGLQVFQCHHKPLLVILSYTISVFGAYCSLRLAAQIPRSSGKALAAWVSGAAIAMGGGAIWSMHFIAMIACRLPVPVTYDTLITMASLAVAILVTGHGLWIVGRGGQRLTRLLAGGTFTGLGVAAMHYTGMAAMRLQAQTTYRVSLVAASVLIAVLAATAALWLAFNLHGPWQRLSASLVMGVAVCGMHYTGMAAAAFVPAAQLTAITSHPGLEPDDLAFMVFGITLFALALLSVGSSVIESKQAQEQLRKRHAVLERQVGERTAELARVNENLKAEIEQRERVHVERVRLAAFSADVGAALTRSESLPRALEACADATVTHLGASFSSIWVLNPKEMVLERRASAGACADLPGSVDRVPIGQFRIGQIAADGIPQVVDLTSEPFQEGDRGWACQNGMVSFAGYPLTVEGRRVGVMSMFSRAPIPELTLRAMATVADAIAVGIERDRAAESLRASEALTRSVIDAMLEGLITVDSKFVIRSVNAAAERIFGHSREDLVGRSLTLLMPDLRGVRPEDFLRDARKQALGRVTEWKGKRKNGELFPFELALFEFWTSEGRHVGGAIRDLSERHEVERLKEEFVSTVSHELRTPLTSIRGALGLISGGAAGTIPTQAKSLVDIALKNSERLSRLVNDILDLEKIQSGSMEFRIRNLELGALLEATVAANRPYADSFGVALQLENSAPGAYVSADSDRLTQAVTNLVSNAVKYSPPNEVVRIGLSGGEGVLRIEIADRGPGIPEEFRSRIFHRFQQADSSDTREKGGTGLGLAITQLIVEKLGGRIGFDSRIGEGSTFWLELPPVQALPWVAQPRNTSTVRPRVLHVDDDLDLPRIVAAALAEAADCDVARSLREARKMLAAATYDLVILDVSLPDGSGLELRRHLVRSPGPPIPFVFFTAHDIPPETAGGAFAVHVKSRSSVDELVESVRTVLRVAAPQAPGRRGAA